jgi:hypothetical protein
MEKNLTVGQLLITSNTCVIGTIQEVVKNRTGSFRVRLTLPNGKTRWTTVK